MSEQDNNLDIASCIGGKFDPVDADAQQQNKWSFRFNKNDTTASLRVDIATPGMLTDTATSQPLVSDLTLDDINQLVNWLFQVKNNMKQNRDSST